MTKIQEEVMESAQLTDTQEERLRNEEHQMSEMLHHLAPWIEKTDGEEVFGDWMQTLPVTMMMKLLGLWLTCDDGHEDELQERRGKASLQARLPDAERRHADTDVRRTHAIHDQKVRTEEKQNQELRVKN